MFRDHKGQSLVMESGTLLLIDSVDPEHIWDCIQNAAFMQLYAYFQIDGERHKYMVPVHVNGDTCFEKYKRTAIANAMQKCALCPESVDGQLLGFFVGSTRKVDVQKKGSRAFMRGS